MPENLTPQNESEAASSIQEQIAEAKENGEAGSFFDNARLGELNKKGKETRKLDKKIDDQETDSNESRSLPKRPSRKKQSIEGEEDRKKDAVPTPPKNHDSKGGEGGNMESESKDTSKKEQPSSSKLNEYNNIEKKPSPDSKKDSQEIDKKFESKTKKNVNEDGQTKSQEVSDNSKEKEDLFTSKEIEPESALDSGREAKLSEIITAGDPVLLDGVNDFDTPGAWFYTGESKMVMDDTRQKSQVKIEFKQPDGTVTEEKEVTWSEITPAYNSDQEYTSALKKIRKIYEQVKEDGGNEAYEKHLANIGSQLMYFSIKLDERQKDKIAKSKAKTKGKES
jgi:ADP-ribose pyrophosphatase YjhB (NUDIX family)